LRYGDVVIIPITSVDQRDEDLCLFGWKDANLIKPTWIKPLLATVSVCLIQKKLGQLIETDVKCIQSAMNQMVDDKLF